jgi:hypothetical protein
MEQKFGIVIVNQGKRTKRTHDKKQGIQVRGMRRKTDEKQTWQTPTQNEKYPVGTEKWL